jgi:hypothetical protein
MSVPLFCLNVIYIFVCFYGTPSQFMSYGADTEKIILTNLVCYNLKATSRVKTATPAGAEICIDTENVIYVVLFEHRADF